MIKQLRSLIIILVIVAIWYIGFMQFQRRQQAIQIDLQKVTIVNQLQSIGALETVKIRLEKVVEGRQGLADLIPGYAIDNMVQEFFFKDSIKMIAYAEIVSGFDLTKISTGSVQVDQNTSGVTLMLPAPQLLHASLTPDTKPFLRTTGILTKGNEQLETQLRNGALETMKEEALQKGILIEAERRAKEALMPLMTALGMTLVDVRVAK